MHAQFEGSLYMESLTVSSDLFMIASTFIHDKNNQKISFISGQIRQNLDLSGATLPSFDGTGLKVGGELRMAGGPNVTKWKPGAMLILRNAEVGVLQDAPDAWPDTLEIEGFNYGRLSGFALDGTSNTDLHKIDWLRAWLNSGY